MQLLYRNLAVLRRADPALAEAVARCAPGRDLELLRARSGAIALRIGGRLECSLEDPRAEAHALAQHFLERARTAGRFEHAWREAENELQRASFELHEDLRGGDPVRLADRTGWTLPLALRRFAVLLEQVAP